jgi:hypothetical protein
MLRRHSALERAVAGLGLAIVAFLVAWAAMFLVLWEFVYGDSYGGRWQKLAWPFGGFAALVALSLYGTHTVYGIRLRWRHLAACLVLLALVGWGGVLFAKRFLWPMPIST